MNRYLYRWVRDRGGELILLRMAAIIPVDGDPPLPPGQSSVEFDGRHGSRVYFAKQFPLDTAEIAAMTDFLAPYVKQAR